MNTCSQETANAVKKLTFKFFASKDLYLFIHSVSTTGQALHLHFLDIHRVQQSFLFVLKNLLPPRSVQEVTRVRITAHDFLGVLNHFQLPKKVSSLTDGLKALSFMVHYQNLVNRNWLFLPAWEDAAECLISGNADCKYDSAIL